MKSIAALGLALAACASIAATAAAQESVPEAAPLHRHTVHHHVHNGERRHAHSLEAQPVQPATAPGAAATTEAPQAAPFGLSWPRIAPYPDGKGDEDGLSEDENDCNKGCIDGTSN
jgi:hypothetical protein